MASRRQFLAANDEDDLIALQEQMRATQAAPSATVTRIKRPGSSTAPTPAAPDVPTCSAGHPHCTHDHSADQMPTPSVESLMASMQNALKGIVGDVKERETTSDAPVPPAPPSAANAAFPAAVNRKQSKFSLARRRAEPAAASQPASTAPAAPAAPIAPAPASAAPQSEAESISAETTAVLAAMTPEQVAAAREEVLSRLAPGAADFLRRRGAQKAAAAAAAAAVASAPGPSNSAPEEGGGQKNVEKKASAAVTTAAGPSQPNGPSQTFNTAASKPPVDLSPVAVAGRLRFDVSGAVVGLSPAAGAATSTAREVATRDPLRQAEGTAAADGYTVDEACVLARSTVPQQRVYALRMLGSLMAAAKPTGDVAANSSVVELPEDVKTALEAEKIASETVKHRGEVTWGEVWRHALHAAQVPVALRVALDDPHAAVVTAATEALAALLSPSTAMATAAATAAATPSLGWPAVPWRHIQRPTPAAAWVDAPVDLETRRQRRQAAAEEGEEEEEEDVNERDLAKVDPMTGLLNMQLLERVVYILNTLQAPGSAAPALEIVAAVAGAGPDAARKAATTPGMMDAIYKALLPSGAVEMRLPAVKALRMLCQGSPAAARAAAAAPGLLTQGVLPLLLRDQTADKAPVDAEKESSSADLRVLSESLRLWRCLSLYGHFLVSGDDVYPSLCRFLAPSMDYDAPLAWETATEGLLALAQLRLVRAVASGAEEEDRWMSRECSAAVARQTAEWVGQLPLVDLLNSGNPEAAAVGTVAAALHFLDAHWASGAEWAPSEDKTAALGALELAGLADGGLAAAALGSLVARLLDAGNGNGWSGGAPPLFSAAAAAAAALSLNRLQTTLGATPAGQATAPLRSPAVTALLERLEGDFDSTLLQPWDEPRLQAALQLARCVAATGGASGEAAAAALCALPPGADDTALHLMARLFSTEALEKSINVAKNAIDEQGEALALLVSEGSGAPPPPRDMPPAAAVGQILLAGYAAEWLGFVQEEAPEAGEAPGPLAMSPTSALLRPDGSRLPLPRGWALLAAPVPPPGSHVSAPPSVAVSYALLRSLGTETPTLRQVKAAIQLAFDSTPQQAQQAEQGEEAWREPLTRWTLAALMARGMSMAAETHETLPKGECWAVPEAQRLIEGFCGGSYGDALYGAAAATTLASALSPLDVQIEALAGLADGRALHLLPPLAALPGPVRGYLDSPPAGDPKEARAAEDAYLGYLGSPDLLKCVQSEAMVLPLLLHRLAGAVFADDSSGDASNDARRQTLFSGAVRRLEAGGGEGRAVLSALLRWDSEEGRAGDAVAAPRLALLEAACAGQEGLLAAAMAALEQG